MVDAICPSTATADLIAAGTRADFTATGGNAVNSAVAPRDGVVIIALSSAVTNVPSTSSCRIAVGVGAVAVITDPMLLSGHEHRISIKAGERVSLFADTAGIAGTMTMARGDA
jgi:hypothetical protein